MLEIIDNPSDLRKLAPEDLPGLCSEIRDYMIDCCSRNPGHLASSLGAVELIVGLHYVYDTPWDRIVFDVGHQTYAHKILTGRREAFADIRKQGGLSGFPNIFESEFDAFGAGHSSTSVSAALGLAQAAAMSGESRHTVALIGDGALTGGLALEGLNNAGSSKADLLVILNDNNQSIDGNIGALHDHLLKLTTNPAYNKVKDQVWNQMGESKVRNFFQRLTKSLKSGVVHKSGGDLFEALGFRYFGPVDGNDISQVVDALGKIKNLKGPRVLHCITCKGKGYGPAESNPGVWHAPGCFDPETGERLHYANSADRYQDVFGQTLYDLARIDRRIVGITPAMSRGCGMNILAENMPDRFFDVGIEEEHAVTFSAGLAAGGMKPFCNIYSTFSQRAYDQIIHDVALQKLPVVLCFDRGGLVGEDGATHHGSFDMAAYRSIPGTVIAAPADERELRNMMFTASRAEEGPFIIRYPRGCGEGVAWRDMPMEDIPVGKSVLLRKGASVAIVAAGPLAYEACRAAEDCFAKTGVSVTVCNARFVKPLDADMLDSIAESHEIVITLEDGCVKGGLFGAVCEYFSKGTSPEIIAMGVPDRFINQGSCDSLHKECGYDRDSILSKLCDCVKKNEKI